jgi:large subunit ribosomal protein LP1
LFSSPSPNPYFFRYASFPPFFPDANAQGVPVTAEAIKKIIDAAGVADVEAFWPGFFAKTAAGIDIKGLLSSVGSGAGSAPAAAAPAAAPAAAGKAAPAAKAKAPEPEPEEEEAGGFSLFDYNSWGYCDATCCSV